MTYIVFLILYALEANITFCIRINARQRLGSISSNKGLIFLISAITDHIDPVIINKNHKNKGRKKKERKK